MDRLVRLDRITTLIKAADRETAEKMLQKAHGLIEAGYEHIADIEQPHVDVLEDALIALYERNQWVTAIRGE